MQHAGHKSSAHSTVLGSRRSLVGSVKALASPCSLPCAHTLTKQLSTAHAVPTLPGNTSHSTRSIRREAAQRNTYPSSNDNNEQGHDTDAADIWTPEPPTPALGRKRKVAVLIAAAMLEITMTGALIWSPLLCAVALAVLQPTKAEIEQQQEDAIKQAVAAAEVQAYRHLPVTPVESAAWMNRLNQDMWQLFWQPFLLANNLSSWQDTVSAAAPKGWEVEIADVSIGTLAPQMSGFQAFADPDTGAVTAVDADMSFNSSSVRLVVVGRGPLGAFTAKVSAVQMEGHMRIIPLLQHRMLLVAFKTPPAVRVSLSLSAPLFKTALSPGDLGQLNFIQGLIGSAIKDQLVEPRRMAISLDSDIRVEQAVSTTLHLSIDSITGLPRSVTAADAAGSRGAAGTSAGHKVALLLVDTTTQVRRASKAVSVSPLKRSALLQQSLSLELRRKQGLFRLEVREVIQGPGGRVSASRGQLLGSCLLWVAAARDGTTLFWSHDRSGAPLATRWSPAAVKPWQVTLPLTAEAPGAQALQVSLGVAVEPWVYKAGLSPGMPGATRTSGPRVVVLQVVEARGLGGSSVGGLGPTTHIQVAYGQHMYCSTTQYGSRSPIFNEVFAFAESPSIINNRIKLEVWQEDTADTAAAAATTGSRTNGASSSSSSKSLNSSSSTSRKAPAPSTKRPGFKAPNKLRHSSSKSSSSSSTNRVSSSGGVTSYQLPDVVPENADSADVDSHMLVDLELQQEVDQEDSEVHSSSSSSSAGNSSSNTDAVVAKGSVSLGSTSIELDQLTEGLVQDRWFELSGSEGAAVRLRLTVVPGALAPTRARTTSSSGRRPLPLVQTSDNDAVTETLAYFHKQLQRSSRDSILVEVVSARLYLPLSSMDSSDLDQPSYVLSYGGTSTVTTPPYGHKPKYTRPSSSSGSSNSSSSSNNVSMSRPSGGASRGSSRSSSTDPSSNSSSSAGRGDVSIPTSSMFEDVAPGNVSQQLVEETCLARAVFPLHESSLQASAAAARQPPDHEPAGAAVAGSGSSVAASRLKVLLFDPEDLSHATPAAAAAAFAAAAVTSSSRGATPSPSPAAAAASTKSNSSNAGVQGPASHPIVVRSSSGSSSSSSNDSLSDVGGVEVNVQKLLAAAKRGTSSSSSTAAGGASGSSKGIAKIDAAGGVSWEGWVRLDKDGGHLLLRLTQLPAAEAADIIPPTSTICTASTASPAAAAAAGGTSSTPGSKQQQRLAAAAAAVAGPAGAAGSSGMVTVEEPEEGLQDKMWGLLSQAQGQVSTATQQVNELSAAATQWYNSSAPSWLNPWRPSSNSSSSSNGSRPQSRSQQPQQQQGQKVLPAADRNRSGSQSKGSKQQATATAPGEQAAPGSQQQQQQQQNWGVDLRFITRALGLAGGAQSSKALQQAKQQPAAALGPELQQQQQQQQPKLDVPSHPLPNHAVQSSVDDQAAGSGRQGVTGNSVLAAGISSAAASASTNAQTKPSSSSASRRRDSSRSRSPDAGGMGGLQTVSLQGTGAAAPAAPAAAGGGTTNSTPGRQQQQQPPGSAAAVGAGAAAAGAAAAAAGLGVVSHPIGGDAAALGGGVVGLDGPGVTQQGAQQQGAQESQDEF